MEMRQKHVCTLRCKDAESASKLCDVLNKGLAEGCGASIYDYPISKNVVVSDSYRKPAAKKMKPSDTAYVKEASVQMANGMVDAVSGLFKLVLFSLATAYDGLRSLFKGEEKAKKGALKKKKSKK